MVVSKGEKTTTGNLSEEVLMIMRSEMFEPVYIVPQFVDLPCKVRATVGR